MRSIFLLVLIMLFGSACANGSAECRQELGEDKSPPREVIDRINSDLKGYRLTDKKECLSETYWIAVSPEQKIDEPRVVGSDKLVVFDKKTRKVTIVLGQ